MHLEPTSLFQLLQLELDVPLSDVVFGQSAACLCSYSFGLLQHSLLVNLGHAMS